MPEITGIAHVELSVRDLEVSVAWYTRLFDAREIFRGTDEAGGFTACAIVEPQSKVVLAFTQHDVVDRTPFTPRRTGLDHLSFLVPSREALDAWVATLQAQGITFDGVNDYETHVAITFVDPDGIALEMIARTPRPA